MNILCAYGEALVFTLLPQLSLFITFTQTLPNPGVCLPQLDANGQPISRKLVRFETLFSE